MHAHHFLDLFPFQISLNYFWQGYSDISLDITFWKPAMQEWFQNLPQRRGDEYFQYCLRRDPNRLVDGVD